MSVYLIFCKYFELEYDEKSMSMPKILQDDDFGIQNERASASMATSL